MTLLITVTTSAYSLISSDMRISVQQGASFIPVEESFNKHIIFHSGGFTGCISYAGIARWGPKTNYTNLYDVISTSVAASAKQQFRLSPLLVNLVNDIASAYKKPSPFTDKSNLPLELHVVARHQDVPWPFVAVLSTVRTVPPWPVIAEQTQWQYHFSGISVFLKASEEPSLVIGGMNNEVTPKEETSLMAAIQRGGDAFNISQMCAKLIKRVSQSNMSVGPKSVAILFPAQGYLDTNLWDIRNNEIMAFVPRIVYSNGLMSGPSEFPISLSLVTSARLPKQSLFFKSIVAKHRKKSIKRKIFRKKKGKMLPGVMGIIHYALFGEIEDGYTISGF